MWMVTNTIFYREDHITSDFKWRKTGLSSMDSTAHKATRSVSGKEESWRWLPDSMTLRWGVAKQRIWVCLAVGYSVIQLNFACCCSDGDIITGFSVDHEVRVQWTSSITSIRFTLLACKGIYETRFLVTFTHTAIEMMKSVSYISLRGHFDNKRYSK